jgi:hypothetical protein
MRTTTNISLWLVRITGTLQLVLGALFWTGHAYGYVPLHIINGFVFVATLWTIAVLALVAQTRRRLAVFALVWGVALPAFGIVQATVLIGPMHWIVRVIHFLMGFAAMALGGMLGQAILAAVPARVNESENERAPVRQ